MTLSLEIPLKTLHKKSVVVHTAQSPHSKYPAKLDSLLTLE